MQPDVKSLRRPDAPLIYADMILNFARTSNVVKFYLARRDPSPLPLVDPSEDLQITSQVVMPIDEFIMTFAFLEKIVESYVRSGHISAEQLASARNIQEVGHESRK